MYQLEVRTTLGHMELIPCNSVIENSSSRALRWTNLLAVRASHLSFKMTSQKGKCRDFWLRWLWRSYMSALDQNCMIFSYNSEHYDRIRIWARRGDNYDTWPFHKRRIFPDDTLMRHPNTRAWVRHGFAYDLLLTSLPETYFAFCMFGMEYVINVGGPSIKGYQQWLLENAGKSPLVEGSGRRLREGRHQGETSHFLEEE